MKSILHGAVLLLLVSAAMTGCASMKHTTDKWGWTDPQPTGLPPGGVKPAPVLTPQQQAEAAAAAAKAQREAAPAYGPGIMQPSNTHAPAVPPPPAPSQTPEFVVPGAPKN
jgi:hypothetical protein